MLNSDLPHRQPRKDSKAIDSEVIGDLPRRQLRIGLEENNLPAEQAVFIRPTK